MNPENRIRSCEFPEDNTMQERQSKKRESKEKELSRKKFTFVREEKRERTSLKNKREVEPRMSIMKNYNNSGNSPG
jgi:hypothetical protein